MSIYVPASLQEQGGSREMADGLIDLVEGIAYEAHQFNRHWPLETGWSRPGVTRMTVNTCDLDHPRALELYQKRGFRPLRSEFRKRILFRDRDTSRHPA